MKLPISEMLSVTAVVFNPAPSGDSSSVAVPIMPGPVSAGLFHGVNSPGLMMSILPITTDVSTLGQDEIVVTILPAIPATTLKSVTKTKTETETETESKITTVSATATATALGSASLHPSGSAITTHDVFPSFTFHPFLSRPTFKTHLSPAVASLASRLREETLSRFPHLGHMGGAVETETVTVTKTETDAAATATITQTVTQTEGGSRHYNPRQFPTYHTDPTPTTA